MITIITQKLITLTMKIISEIRGLALFFVC
jgi:hypothetical protein